MGLPRYLHLVTHGYTAGWGSQGLSARQAPPHPVFATAKLYQRADSERTQLSRHPPRFLCPFETLNILKALLRRMNCAHEEGS